MYKNWTVVFYTFNIMSVATIGIVITLLFAVLLRREILVRDIYLLIVFFALNVSAKKNKKSLNVNTSL